MTVVKSELLKRVLKRRSFTGLMDLYEINYGLLNRLVPQLERIDVRAVSKVPGCPDLHLAVEARCPFTTMLHLTYYFTEADGRRVADPDLQVRLYHDARQAEAVACRLRGFMPLEPVGIASRNELECRWDSNLFLEKWLRYSLSLGHRFDPDFPDSDLPSAPQKPSLTTTS